jgi:hypothetical protein
MVRGKDNDGLSTDHIVGVPMEEGDGLVLVGLVSITDVEGIDVSIDSSTAT